MLTILIRPEETARNATEGTRQVPFMWVFTFFIPFVFADFANVLAYIGTTPMTWDVSNISHLCKFLLLFLFSDFSNVLAYPGTIPMFMTPFRTQDTLNMLCLRKFFSSVSMLSNSLNVATPGTTPMLMAPCRTWDPLNMSHPGKFLFLFFFSDVFWLSQCICLPQG